MRLMSSGPVKPLVVIIAAKNPSSTGRAGGNQMLRSASARALQTSNTPSSQALTHREYEVLALLAAGHPMKRIAYRLGITYRNVTFHKYRMMERLGIKTNAGLMSYALKRNISESFEDNEAVVLA